LAAAGAAGRHGGRAPQLHRADLVRPALSRRWSATFYSRKFPSPPPNLADRAGCHGCRRLPGSHVAVIKPSQRRHASGLLRRDSDLCVKTMRFLSPDSNFTYAAPDDAAWRRAAIHAVEQLTGKPRLWRLYAD